VTEAQLAPETKLAPEISAGVVLHREALGRDRGARRRRGEGLGSRGRHTGQQDDSRHAGETHTYSHA
jgi:hypothetical protein